MLSEKLGIESKKVLNLESSNSDLSDLLEKSRSDFDRSLSRSNYLESLSKNLGLGLSFERSKVSSLESTLHETNSSLSDVNMDLDNLRSENCDYLVQVSSLTSDLEVESKKVSTLTSQILILEQSLSDSSSLSNLKKQDLELELSNLNYVLKASNSKISSLNLDLETCKSEVLIYTLKLEELELIEDGLISSSTMLSEKLGIESKKVSDLESSNFKLSDLLDSSRSDFDRSLSRSDYLESLSEILGLGLFEQKNLTSNL